nr:YozQ family protein [Neobacillus dielmonensis]
MSKKNQSDSTELAGRVFHEEDYQKSDTLSSGLATTHEQAMDAYMEGEIGGVMEDVAGKDIPLGKDDAE